MRERIWTLLAWLLTREAVFRLLVRIGMRTPYLHIGDYMHRYWLISPKWRLPFCIRLNHILRPDADPYLHDHPWRWRTIILRGWYGEENVEGEINYMLPGMTRAASAETMHRIERVSPGGVWTLFITGKRKNRWGFMVGRPARKVYYRNYFSENDRDGSLRHAPRDAA